MTLQIADIEAYLGEESDSLLAHRCRTIPKEQLHLPGPDFVDRAVALSDRPTPVLRNLDPAGGSGHRALGRRVVCAELDLL